MSDPRTADLVGQAADLLKAAARRWGDEIPPEVLTEMALVCLSTATGHPLVAAQAVGDLAEMVLEP